MSDVFIRAGQMRDESRLRDKAAANAKVYANLPKPMPSRQVQRRVVRKAVRHQIALAKKAAIANRRRQPS
jgi:hypothetical protein